MTSDAVDEIRARAEAIRTRIVAAGATPATVRLIAVTKGFPSDIARLALAAGLDDLGENYAQEMVAKVAAVAPVDGSAPSATPRWHFLGRLQRNKVRMVADHVALWQSVDRLSLGREIERRVPGAAVLVQVNLSGEEQKGGCARTHAAGLVESLDELGLAVRGLMGVAPAGPPEDAREGFRWLRAEVDRLGLHECSIGMSADLEVAVQEGATMVRVGTGIFGPRQ